MEKVKVSVNELVKDIRAQVPDDLIAAKHCISLENLTVLKRTLLTNKLVTFRELRAQSARSKGKKKVLNAQRFLKDFHEKSDDYFLMEKYGLKARQLGKAYRKLMERGWLTEFEFFTREIKCPELDDLSKSTPVAASTVVTFVEREQGVDAIAGADSRYDGLPKEFYRDRSGVKIGGGSDGDPAPIPELTLLVSCPSCGAPRMNTGYRFCWSCGTDLSQ